MENRQALKLIEKIQKDLLQDKFVVIEEHKLKAELQLVTTNTDIRK